MKTLGEYLQAERESRGISLEAIAAETKISVGILRALEEGNTERLPAPVLVKGFLRAYAEQVGIDPDALVLRYQEIIGEEEARREALEKFHRRMYPRQQRRLPVLLLVVVVLGAFGAGIYWWLQGHTPTETISGAPMAKSAPTPAPPAKPEMVTSSSADKGSKPESAAASPAGEAAKVAATAPQEPTAGEHAVTTQEVQQQAVETAATTAPEPAPAEAPVSPPTAAVASAPEAVSQPAAAVAPVSSPTTAGEASAAAPEVTPSVAAAPGKHRLRIEAIELTWLQVSIDGEQQREYLLRPGDVVRLEADSFFALTVGNAAGLRLQVDGQTLKPLGESGEVVRLRLPDPELVAADSAIGPESRAAAQQ